MHNKTKFVVISLMLLLIGFLIFFYYSVITGYATRNDAQALIVSLDISSDQQKIKPGESLLLEVAIREPGGTMEETSIIDLDYVIKDSQGTIISEKKESGAIAVKQSEVTGLLIPTDTKPGVYTAFVNVNYKGNIYVGSKTFEVVSYAKTEMIAASIIFIIFIIIIIFLIGNKINKKLKTEKKKLFKRYRRR
ncbi:MAG: hypothetical protein AABX28_01530 [Nanoarchaeota archaeon]